MPLVRIDLIQGKSSDYRGAIGEVIYKSDARNLERAHE